MAVIGISLLVASVVIFCLRPPAWLPGFLGNLSLRLGRASAPPSRPPIAAPESDVDVDEDEDESSRESLLEDREEVGSDEVEKSDHIEPPVLIIQEPEQQQDIQAEDEEPQEPALLIREPEEEVAGNFSVQADQSEEERLDQAADEEQATPKASATPNDDAVPSLVLPEGVSDREPEPSSPEPSSDSPSPMRKIPVFTTSSPPNPKPASDAPRSAAELMPPPPPRSSSPRNTSARGTSIPSLSPARASALMPPPPPPASKPVSTSNGTTAATTRIPRRSAIPQPRSPASPATTAATPASASPSSSSPTPRRIPTLNGTAYPAGSRNLPIPRRGAPSGGAGGLSVPGGGGLAPPPTATGIPKKPSRQVTLEPGHSPLDWARLAQSPTSDLRGLPPNTPYLRVTPSMLRQQNGRHGRDAWSVYGGKVYNVSPYVPFHPGGRGELLRGAGKDATRLFAEVHPWVNYETMLQSCLIGLMVEEHEAANQMEEMD